jgi:DNA primase
MGLDFDTFLRWATNKFGAENIRFRGNEICTHSMFADEDHKFHLWMNPSGGKKGLKGGAYRCWKTDKRGSLIALVAHLDRIDYEEAEELLTGTTSLRALEKKLEEYFGCQGDVDYNDVPEIKQRLELPLYTYLIEDLSSSHGFRVRAEAYLEKRKIPTDGLYVCIKGDYRNRIVIPYYNSEGDLIYFNARTMDTNPKALRYMKPDSDEIKQNEILYMKEWPRKGSQVYITEGEFDAMTLNLCGLYGTACGGKFLSQSQVELLRPYVPVLATDGDISGKKALVSIGTELQARGFEKVYYVRPPKNYKDWNAVLEKHSPETIKDYITKNQKIFTQWTQEKFLAEGS